MRINGQPGFVLRDAHGVTSVVTLTVGDNAVQDVWIVVNPDKLARVGAQA